MWLILAFGSAFFAALVAIWGKIGVQNVDPALDTTVRAAVFFVFLSVVSLTLGKLPLLSQIQGRPMKYLILSGVAGAMSWLLYFWALKLGQAGKVATIDRMSLVFVLIMAALLLGEKLTLLKGISGALVVFGAVLVALG